MTSNFEKVCSKCEFSNLSPRFTIFDNSDMTFPEIYCIQKKFHNLNNNIKHNIHDADLVIVNLSELLFYLYYTCGRLGINIDYVVHVMQINGSIEKYFENPNIEYISESTNYEKSIKYFGESCSSVGSKLESINANIKCLNTYVNERNLFNLTRSIADIIMNTYYLVYMFTTIDIFQNAFKNAIIREHTAMQPMFIDICAPYCDKILLFTTISFITVQAIVLFLRVL